MPFALSIRMSEILLFIFSGCIPSKGKQQICLNTIYYSGNNEALKIDSLGSSSLPFDSSGYIFW